MGSSRLPRVGMCHFFHRTTVHEALPKANLPQLHVQIKAEFLNVNTSLFRVTDDAIRGLELQVVFLVCRMVFFSCGARELSSMRCKEAQQSKGCMWLLLRSASRPSTIFSCARLRKQLSSCGALCGVSTTCVVPSLLDSRVQSALKFLMSGELGIRSSRLGCASRK